MEADTSIWQKTGHFYFALTGPPHALRPVPFPTHHRCLSPFRGVPYAPSWSLVSVRLPVFGSEEVFGHK